MGYVAIIHKDPDSDSASAFLIFQAASPPVGHSTRPRIWPLEALSGHIEVMRDAGESVPAPSGLDEVMRHPQFRNGVAFLVRIKEPARVNPG